MDSKVAQYLEQIYTAQRKLISINNSVSSTHTLFAYRGEARNYNDSSLMPTLFRDNYSDKEIMLFDLLEDYGVIKNTDRYVEKGMIAQHYTEISRLLDISFNALVALFFACNSHNGSNGKTKKHGFVYVFSFPEYFSPHSSYIEELFLQGSREDSCIYDKNFRIISYASSNERVTAQSGGFILFPGKTYTQIPTAYYEKVIINKDDKDAVLKELEELFCISKERLFPDKNNYAGLAKKQFLANDNNDSFAVSVDNEINVFLKRLDYELDVLIKKEKEEPSIVNLSKYIHRVLRKEKSDLLAYLNQLDWEKCKHIKNSTDLEKEIDKNFILLGGCKHE